MTDKNTLKKLMELYDEKKKVWLKAHGTKKGFDAAFSAWLKNQIG